MGNVSGRIEEISEVREEYMECAHGGAHVSYPAPQDSMDHPPRVYSHTQRPYEMMQIPNNVSLSTPNTEHRDSMRSELGVPTMITWCYDGKQVAVLGSWDCWKTREFLQKTGDDFTVLKVLPPGVYHYQFIVDGQWQYSPDFPHERDDTGNVFNVLDVKKTVLEDMSEFEFPSSPVSSYDNSPFTKEDLNEKLPELPPLLQQSLLDQPLSSEDTFEKPLPSVLNHLYIRKGCSSQSLTALSSTHRFRSKYVTVVLYKPARKPGK